MEESREKTIGERAWLISGALYNRQGWRVDGQRENRDDGYDAKAGLRFSRTNRLSATRVKILSFLFLFEAEPEWMLGPSIPADQFLLSLRWQILAV